MMRANVFCVGSSLASKSMSFDECNEHYNMHLKTSHVTPNLQEAPWLVSGVGQSYGDFLEGEGIA
jgi:hypothetical protein